MKSFSGKFPKTEPEKQYVMQFSEQDLINVLKYKQK